MYIVQKEKQSEGFKQKYKQIPATNDWVNITAIMGQGYGWSVFVPRQTLKSSPRPTK